MVTDCTLKAIVVACPDCDLINKVPELAPGQSACCLRCEATLSRNPPNSLGRCLALTATALILYVISCSFSFLSFAKAGIVSDTRLFSGIAGLYEEGMYFLAGTVSVTIVVVPLFILTGLCYLLLPLYADIKLPGAERVLRWLLRLQPLNMVEIFMISIIVAGIKLQKMAELEPGLAAWSFMAMILVMTAITAIMEPRLLWERLEKARCLPRHGS